MLAHGPGQTVFADRKLAGVAPFQHILDIAEQKTVVFYLKHHKTGMEQRILQQLRRKNIKAAFRAGDVVIISDANFVFSGDIGLPPVFHHGTRAV